MTKKRVLHLSLPTFWVTWILIERFSALSSSVPSSVQNASWRNSRASYRRAGGPVTKRISPPGFLDYARIHILYQEIIANLCTHSSSSSPIRPPSRTSHFTVSSDRLDGERTKQVRLAKNECKESMDTKYSKRYAGIITLKVCVSERVLFLGTGIP